MIVSEVWVVHRKAAARIIASASEAWDEPKKNSREVVLCRQN
jgi:hypothetical protein